MGLSLAGQGTKCHTIRKTDQANERGYIGGPVRSTAVCRSGHNGSDFVLPVLLLSSAPRLAAGMRPGPACLALSQTQEI